MMLSSMKSAPAESASDIPAFSSKSRRNALALSTSRGIDSLIFWSTLSSSFLPASRRPSSISGRNSSSMSSPYSRACSLRDSSKLLPFARSTKVRRVASLATGDILCTISVFPSSSIVLVNARSASSPARNLSRSPVIVARVRATLLL